MQSCECADRVPVMRTRLGSEINLHVKIGTECKAGIVPWKEKNKATLTG